MIGLIIILSVAAYFWIGIVIGELIGESNGPVAVVWPLIFFVYSALYVGEAIKEKLK